MKGIILAGGRGKRLDDISANKNKCMIQVHGKPVLEYNLEYASSTTVDEIIVVVGYRAEEIINHYGIRFGEKRIKYVIQWEQRGLVHAIECAKEALEGQDFFLFLGDEYLSRPRHQAMLEEFQRSAVFALCGVLTVQDREMIRRTYTLIQDESGAIHRLVEKPRNPLNNLMGTGGCIFKNDIFRYSEFTPIHHERKEKELPDLIQCAIDDGKLVKSFSLCEKYTNINSREDIQMAESFV